MKKLLGPRMEARYIPVEEYKRHATKAKLDEVKDFVPQLIAGLQLSGLYSVVCGDRGTYCETIHSKSARVDVYMTLTEAGKTDPNARLFPVIAIECFATYYDKSSLVKRMSRAPLYQAALNWRTKEGPLEPPTITLIATPETTNVVHEELKERVDPDGVPATSHGVAILQRLLWPAHCGWLTRDSDGAVGFRTNMHNDNGQPFYVLIPAHHGFKINLPERNP